MSSVLTFWPLMARTWKALSGIKRRAILTCISKKLALVCDSGSRGGRGSILETNCVVLDKLLHVAVSPASVEVIFLHLGVDLLEVPVVMIEAIDSAHDAGAMTSARAVNEKLAG